MRIVKKPELIALIENTNDRCLVFAEYEQGEFPTDIRVLKDDEAKTISIMPTPGGRLLSQLFSRDRYQEDDMFVVFSVREVWQMIRILHLGLPEDMTEYMYRDEDTDD